MMRSLIAITAGTLVLTASAVALTGQTPSKTTNSAVFTAAQAARGKQVFETKCTTCHEPARFTGAGFIDVWEGKPLKEVWDIVSGTMPEDNPGSLKPQEYGDVLAYLLELNTFPAGSAELPGEAGAMANIKIEKPKK